MDDLTTELDSPESEGRLFEVAVLTGVTLPETGYVGAIAADVLGATLKVRSDLATLRAHKAEVARQIRLFVAYETYLTRMSRIADELLGEEVNDDDGTGEGDGDV